STTTKLRTDRFSLRQTAKLLRKYKIADYARVEYSLVVWCLVLVRPPDHQAQLRTFRISRGHSGDGLRQPESYGLR
ncbi:MAG: hypothetical protein QME81_08320, partial [bacterium]|nr:hypothetical protein [bacterium]